MKTSELRKLSLKDLYIELEEQKGKLGKLGLRLRGGEIAILKDFRLTKRMIARALTLIREAEGQEYAG